MTNKRDQKKLDNTASNIEGQIHPSSSGGGIYAIHVKGQLDRNWSDWFEGLEVKLLENGEMIFIGPIIDQAALLGVLIKLNRLNLALLSVNPKNKEEEME